MDTTIRVLLVDDHAVLRAGLRVLLEAERDIHVVGEAASGEDGIRRAEELRPDVVVMDLSMPRMDGLEATRRITAAGLPVRVLVLTVDPEADSLVPVLEAGAVGYVAKGASDGQLVEAIRVVSRGDPFLPPGSVRLLTESLRTGRPPAPQSAPLSLLSGRERDVLALTAEGFSSAEIGERLGLSHKTVDTYRQRLMGKLGLHRRSEVVHFALDHGLLAAITT
jgi:two-component system, NarL family, response regulator NreC